MTKKFGIMVLCATLALVTTACGGKQEKTTDTTTAVETTVEKTTVEVTTVKETTIEETTVAKKKKLNSLVKSGYLRFTDYVHDEGINEYSIDLNYDGTDEKIKIDYNIDEDILNSCFKISINNQEMILIKEASSISMIFVDIDPTDSSVEIILAVGNFGVKREMTVYKYENEKLVSLNDSIEYLDSVAVYSEGDGKLIVDTEDSAHKIGCFRRKVFYEYQNGKLKDASTNNIYEVSDFDYSENVKASSKYNYKVTKDILLYKDATCKKKVGTIKANDVVTINRVMTTIITADNKPALKYYISAVEIKVNGKVVGWLGLQQDGDYSDGTFEEVPLYD